MVQFLDTCATGFEAQFTAFLQNEREKAADIAEVVTEIITDVRARGDGAVIEWTERFDKLSLTPETFAFRAADITEIIATVPSTQRAASLPNPTVEGGLQG